MLKDPQNRLTSVLSVMYDINLRNLRLLKLISYMNEYLATSSQLRASSCVCRSSGLCVISDEAHHIATY